MKIYLYNSDPYKLHFYIVELGFTGVYIIFLTSAQNTDCGYLIELPHWGSSNAYLQSTFWAEIWKLSEFLSENFPFLVVKFSIYLNRGVFIMDIFCKWSANAKIRLCRRAGWPWSLMSACTWKHIFIWHGLNVVNGIITIANLSNYYLYNAHSVKTIVFHMSKCKS